ncbi:MAG: nucleotidyltransferase family protein [Bacteroidota bacterium]
MRASAILLAAGMSTRMGEQNKLLLPLGGKPIIEQSLETLLAASPADVVVVLGHQASRVREALSYYEGKVRFVTNPDFEQGMTSSIQAGVQAIAPDALGVMVCLGDMPFLTSFDLQQLGATFTQQVAQNPKTIVVPTYEGQRGNPVTFSMAFRGEILDHTNQEGCKGLVKRNPEYVVEVASAGKDVRLDIDTPEEYAEMEALWKQRQRA